MMIGATIAYVAAGIFLAAPAFSVWQICSFLIAVFWIYRVGSLVHEVAHLGGHELTSLRDDVGENLSVTQRPSEV